MPRGQNPNSIEALLKHQRRFDHETGKAAKKKSDAAKIKKKEAVLTFSETARKILTQEKKEAIMEACEAYARKGSLPHLEMLIKLLGEDESVNRDDRVEYVYPEGDEELNG